MGEGEGEVEQGKEGGCRAKGNPEHVIGRYLNWLHAAVFLILFCHSVRILRRFYAYFTVVLQCNTMVVLSHRSRPRSTTFVCTGV